jgi:hypothetical protein
VQQRLDQDPQAVHFRRETVEHPFGTPKMRMGATHFLMKMLPRVANGMALSVLAYNLTRVMNIVDSKRVWADRLLLSRSHVRHRDLRCRFGRQPRYRPMAMRIHT